MKFPDVSDRRFVALASDYDGTLAKDGEVSAATLEALRRFKARGGRLILVTGRVLPELIEVFPDKYNKNGSQCCNRFFYPPEIQNGKHYQNRECKSNFIIVILNG